MEIKTAFAVIIGIVMSAVVIVALIVIMGGLTNVSIGECIPAEYEALDTYTGNYCGLDSTNAQVYCDVVAMPGPNVYKDDCFDGSRNLCCPTAKNKIGWDVRIIKDRCCNITRT